MRGTSEHSRMQQLKRKLALFRQKQETDSVRHPIRSSLPFLCLSGVVLTAAVLATSCTLCYTVDAQGRLVTFFQDEETYQAAVTQAEVRTSQILNTPYSFNQDVTVRTTLASRDAVESLPGVTDSIMEIIPELEHVYTLSIDGTVMAAAESADILNQALNLVTQRYTTPETRSLRIENQVDIRYQYLPASTGVATAEQIAAILLQETPRTFPYTTQEGDTVESLTETFAMTPERFQELNPDLDLEAQRKAHLEKSGLSMGESDTQNATDLAGDETQKTEQEAREKEAQALEALVAAASETPLEPGLTLTIEQSCPLLMVSTVEEMNLSRAVTPEIQTQPDDTMFTGQQRIIQEGEAGEQSVLARVVKRCGVPVASNDLSAMTVSEPTPLIVGMGTQPMPELPEDCMFLWPVKGTITSQFGYRFIFGENNFHRGLDIAAPQGTAINAAADATVLFAGEKGTYGNLVILDHHNGFLTYYGHCSKLLVRQGDTVTQGQPIAAVGSTGPHCHFEVRYNNSPIDPLLYLPGENNAPNQNLPQEEPEAPVQKPEPPAPPTEPEQPVPPPTPPEEPEDPQPEPPEASDDTQLNTGDVPLSQPASEP